MKTVGHNIRNLRRQKGWSQEDVAKRLDISIPAFSKIETGITDINLSRLVQVAAIFEMSAVQLLMLDDDNQEQVINAMDNVYKKLLIREAELAALQKKVIQLFEELRESKVSV